MRFGGNDIDANISNDPTSPSVSNVCKHFDMMKSLKWKLLTIMYVVPNIQTLTGKCFIENKNIDKTEILKTESDGNSMTSAGADPGFK